MLIAVAITLVMMATVVGVFATVSSSVQKRRAVVEVGNQMRHVRNVLQRDLEGATCPLLPWQKPESNHGYFEIVEGLHADFFPSLLTDGQQAANNPEIDHTSSTLPSSNLPLPAGWVTDGGGLGDYDDILAFTTRNEAEPFSGRVPDRSSLAGSASRNFGTWQSEIVTSPVAEVVWYALENPVADTGGYFGNASQAGFRTIYRRVLLVAPWLNYNFNIANTGAKSRPGVLRVLDQPAVPENRVDQALAALIAFQERFDISARIEFDRSLGSGGRWTIVANTLADLTKRENRYEHHGYVLNAGRRFPFVLASAGGNSTSAVRFVVDPEYGTANAGGADVAPLTEGNAVVGYQVRNRGNGNIIRPLAVLEGGATARVMIDEQGRVIHATTGLVPLGVISPTTSRRGEDLMLSQALAFDVQVFDPDAPIYALRQNGQVLDNSTLTGLQANQVAGLDVTTVGPGSLGWLAAVTNLPPAEVDASPARGGAVVSRGAYVDLGYIALHDEVRRRTTGSGFVAAVSTPFSGLAHGKSQLLDARLTRVYDTWSFHYEHDGLDQDGDGLFDEGTNGVDDPGEYADGRHVRLGVDDFGERETSPPYPVPLRGIQITLRVHEPDSGQLREVNVRQHFVPE